ncbi:MAG: hypothetical protein MI784_04085 [Cytophagales bacterium]|nr:hypothetical protein [Cytophagales bacterium]
MKKIFTIILALCAIQGWAQKNESKKNPFDHRPLKWHLNEDHTSSVSLGMVSQFWVRSIENNPGTLGLNGEKEDHTFNFGIRRFRMIFKGNFNNNFFFFTQLGTNNMNFSSSKTPSIYFHDAWGMFKAADKKLYIGAGLHYFGGISRITSTSTSSQLTLDHPIINYPTVGHTDHTCRQLGVFATGTLGRLNYRLAVNQPYAYGSYEKELLDLENIKKVEKSVQAFELRTNDLNYKGYFSYQFKDVVHSTSSAFPMTYLGSKSVFNIGFGFDYLANSMAVFENVNNNYELRKQDQLKLGFDVFYEKPYRNQSVLTVYGAWFKYDMGSNYLRSVGVMNPSAKDKNNKPVKTKEQLDQGSANSYYAIGSGDVFYAQAGYLLPEKIKLGTVRFQPFAAYTLQDFDAFSEKGTVYDMGVNCLVAKQNMKITAQYSLRPLFANPVGDSHKRELTEHLGTFLLQLQFKL